MAVTLAENGTSSMTPDCSRHEQKHDSSVTHAKRVSSACRRLTPPSRLQLCGSDLRLPCFQTVVDRLKPAIASRFALTRICEYGARQTRECNVSQGQRPV